MTEKKEDWMQALKFLLFSISAGVVQVATFSIMEAIHITYWVSYLTSLLCSIIWNFTLNRKFTFKSANNVPIAMLKVLAFYAVFTPLSTIGGNALERAGWNDFIVLVISMVLNFVLEFFYSKYVTFRGSINTNELATAKKMQSELKSTENVTDTIKTDEKNKGNKKSTEKDSKSDEK